MLPDDIMELNQRAYECTNILYGLEDSINWQSISPTFDYLNFIRLRLVTMANREVLAELVEAMQYFVYGFGWDFGYTGWYAVHQGLYDMDHDHTIAAWVLRYANAHDDHRNAHRLILDAYQASMYDKPFDQEYHSLWVERFKSWA